MHLVRKRRYVLKQSNEIRRQENTQTQNVNKLKTIQRLDDPYKIIERCNMQEA